MSRYIVHTGLTRYTTPADRNPVPELMTVEADNFEVSIYESKKGIPTETLVFSAGDKKVAAFKTWKSVILETPDETKKAA